MVQDEEKELESIIEKFKHEAIIIINDFRLFGRCPKKGTGAEDWEDISKDKVIEIVKSRLEKEYHCPSKHASNDRLILHIKKLQKPKINTAIVISTTKKYEFIWETFFTLLYKHWPKCEYPIFLISDGNPKKLKDNTFDNEVQVGVTAQEIREVIPSAVKPSYFDGYDAVHYEKIVPLLIESIKELSKEVESLKDSKT